MSDSATPSAPDAGRGIDLSRFVPHRSFGLKLLLVCALAMIMAIPATFVWGLVYMRSTDASAAVAGVAQLRGGAQTLMGPAIVVPVDRDVLNASSNTVQTVTQRLVLYPETGSVAADLRTEKLTRGLHDVPVYTADARFTAVFDASKLAAEAPAGARIRWADARVYMSLTDLRGAKDATLTLNGRVLELAPAELSGQSSDGYAAPMSYQRLVGAPIPWLEEAVGAPITAAARLRVTGAERVALAAFAKDTTIEMTGDWASPSFDGGALPDAREVTDAGFKASWRIPFLARGAAGAGLDLSFETVTSTSPGATLLDTANPYKSVQRALKYAPMFIGLVFLSYFLFEVTSGARAHPAQYVLVGLAQLVFYLLLLSVSEQLGFTLGFLVAAIGTVSAISFYAGSVFGSRAAMIKAFAVFSTLYALIYVLMRMEDYALLVGSIASFLAITATMWMTRNLDWYGVGRASAPKPEQAV